MARGCCIMQRGIAFWTQDVAKNGEALCLGPADTSEGCLGCLLEKETTTKYDGLFHPLTSKIIQTLELWENPSSLPRVVRTNSFHAR